MTDDLDFNQAILLELKELNNHHSNISTYLQLIAQTEFESRLSKIFSNPEEKKAYELSDGKMTSSDIGKITNQSQIKISRLWQKWDEDLGIVETSGYRNPYKAKYSLIELALHFSESNNDQLKED